MLFFLSEGWHNCAHCETLWPHTNYIVVLGDSENVCIDLCVASEGMQSIQDLFFTVSAFVGHWFFRGQNTAKAEQGFPQHRVCGGGASAVHNILNSGILIPSRLKYSTSNNNNGKGGCCRRAACLL